MQVAAESNGLRRGLFSVVVVLAIFSFVLFLIAYNSRGALDDSNPAAAKAQIKNIETAIIAYKQKYNRFPERLDDLVENPDGINFLNSKRLPTDPWDRHYAYVLRGADEYVITSYGGDGAPGGNDFDADISSDDLKSAM